MLLEDQIRIVEQLDNQLNLLVCFHQCVLSWQISQFSVSLPTPCLCAYLPEQVNKQGELMPSSGSLDPGEGKEGLTDAHLDWITHTHTHVQVHTTPHTTPHGNTTHYTFHFTPPPPPPPSTTTCHTHLHTHTTPHHHTPPPLPHTLPAAAHLCHTHTHCTHTPHTTHTHTYTLPGTVGDGQLDGWDGWVGYRSLTDMDGIGSVMIDI